jgi:S-adenosylmethionine decarboxylase
MVELWGCQNLDSTAVVEEALREAVQAAGVTMRDLQVLPWEPYNGVSAIAIIAESHISVHTWPEMGYAAVDIFTCGERANPDAAVPVFQRYFAPQRLEVMQISRGVILD